MDRGARLSPAQTAHGGAARPVEPLCPRTLRAYCVARRLSRPDPGRRTLQAGLCPGECASRPSGRERSDPAVRRLSAPRRISCGPTAARHADPDRPIRTVRDRPRPLATDQRRGCLSRAAGGRIAVARASCLKLARLRRDGTTLFMAGSLLINLLRIVSTVALTRLLNPADFGAMGIVASIQFVLIMISDVGFFAYVMRKVDEGENQRQLLDEVWT
ncbi:MAG: hypothetical protein EOP61_37300, partial [Sphingomonadales bacterium]